jgi:hypothetical protein
VHLPANDGFGGDDVFNVYLAGKIANTAAVDGGDVSDVKTGNDADADAAAADAPDNRCVFVCLHGGGHSALSWALVAQRLKATRGVVAIDLRYVMGDCVMFWL